MKNVRTFARPDPTITKREVKHQDLAREIATESIVLLENDGVLPIQARPIALYGAGGLMTIKGGTGSGEVNVRHTVSIYEGLTNAGFFITTKRYNQNYKKLLEGKKAKHNKSIIKKALLGSSSDYINLMGEPFFYPPGPLITDKEIQETNCDTCIYVVARQAGESADRNLYKHDFTLDVVEQKNIEKVANEYKNTIVVLNMGGSFDVSSILQIKGVNALLFFCQQGMQGGNALVDVLTGKKSPSGCLTSTWPKTYNDVPYGEEYSYHKEKTRTQKNNTEVRELYKEGIYVGYRYYDTFAIPVAYPFGYGKTYSSFSIDYMYGKLNGCTFYLVVRVTNTGRIYSGKKVVQVYLSCPDGKLEREFQSLVTYSKTKVLSPGEFEDINLCFTITDFAAYDEELACFILEKGEYIVRIGHSSQIHSVCVRIKLDQTVIVEQNQNICPLNEGLILLKQQKSEKNTQNVNLQDKQTFCCIVDAFTLDPSAIKKSVVDYGHKDAFSFAELDLETSLRFKKIWKTLSIEEMIDLIVGVGIFPSLNRFEVPGAAGFTTSNLYQKGIPNVALCDGPAGIRVQKTAVLLPSGKIKNCGPSMEFMEYLPSPVKKVLMADPSLGQPLYQFTTAFPVGTAVSQTWNTTLIEQMGDAIGTEMEEYGITYWLGPGMNIQRNPLCGRNFEYFSEDPVLTGTVATAITKGVQKHKGKYVTIKHYACNNAEYKRNYSDSIINERTLREIYLKGFRMVIEQGKAKAVMSSYNKINGEYTPNSFDLLTNVLRKEWGFFGVVMTDWLSTGKGLADNALAIKAGNDMIMPGGMYPKKELKKALKDGRISKEEIKVCCFNVLSQVLGSKTNNH